MVTTHFGQDETLGARAYRDIREGILNGTFKPGSRLPMRQLAESLSMSLAPVGQALRELARDGLIETEPKWGARVREIDAGALRDYHIVRTALECEAARHCAVLATPQQFGDLNTLAAELDERIDGHGDPRQVHQLDARFHLRLAELARCQGLVEGLRSNQLVRLLALGSLITYDMRRATKQHVALAAEISSGAPDRAERAMRSHCEASMQLQLSYLNQATS